MSFPKSNNVLVRWQGHYTLSAVKEPEGTAFYLQEGEGKQISCRRITNVRGWIPPDEIALRNHQEFYQKLTPLFNADQTWVILTLFVKNVCVMKKVKEYVWSYPKVGEAVGFLENKKCRILFFPHEGVSFVPELKGISPPDYDGVTKCYSSWDWERCLKHTLIVKNSHLKWKSFPIYIKELTGKTLTIKLTIQNSIADLKEKVRAKTNIPTDQQRLLFGGKMLDNDRTLLDYNLSPQSTIHLVLRLRGGGPQMVDFNDFKKEKRVALTSEGPAWRTVAPGLNLKGVCKNDQCAASNQTVWIQRGISSYFNMNRECETAPCPQCKEFVTDVNNCGFYRCIFSVYGVTEEGKEFSSLCNVRAPDNELLSFEDSVGSVKQWRKLIIKTKNPIISD